MIFPTPLSELTELSTPLSRLSLSKFVFEYIMANYKDVKRAEGVPNHIYGQKS